ncbi:MAG: hypothetical protein GWP91_20280, partial [Rhodobacterales bacterium]|nr:hypothetical protein [Rhodobacterales bacterium]
AVYAVYASWTVENDLLTLMLTAGQRWCDDQKANDNLDDKTRRST